MYGRTAGSNFDRFPTPGPAGGLATAIVATSASGLWLLSSRELREAGPELPERKGALLLSAE